MARTGRLIQPIFDFKWGDENLSNLVNTLSISLTDNPKTCPTCRVGWHPTPESFETFERLKKTSLRKSWVVGIGYTNSDLFEMNFTYAGVQLNTGMKPSLATMGVSPVKGCWTENTITYSRSEAIKLIDLPEDLKKKAGSCAANIKVEFIGPAKEAAEKSIEITETMSNMTPHNILKRILQPEGMEISTADTVIKGGPILVSFSSSNIPEDKKEDFSEEPGKPRLRSFHLFGPGLINQVNRSQSFNLNHNLIAGLASPKNPVIPQVDQAGVVDQGATTSEETIVNQQTGEATQGQTNAATGETAVSKKETGSDEARKRRVELAKIISTTMNADIPMLPKVVGIKPRDVAVIAGNNAFLEDWIISTVKYNFNVNGSVLINVTGKRPFTGDEPMYTGSVVEEDIKRTIKSLKTVEDWTSYYWRSSSEGGGN